MSLTSSLKPYLLSYLCGIRDSFLGVCLLVRIDYGSSSATDKRDDSTSDVDVRYKSKRPEPKRKEKVLPMLAQCCLLNGGILLLSVMLFESWIIPAVKLLLNFFIVVALGRTPTQSFLWRWLEPTMACTFKYLWVIPLFWLCKLLNCFWFVEIGDVAYRKKYGRPLSSLLSAAKNDSIFKVLSRTMADFLFSIKVELLFMVQAQLVGLLPYVGPSLSFTHMCLLYSLYAFEYTWLNLGWSVMKRLAYIERNWSYFMGFGVLLTTLTSLSNSTVISACIFGIVFPLFILSGLEAKPYENPNLMSLRLFALVIWITNKIFLKSGPVKGPVKRGATTVEAVQTSTSEHYTKRSTELEHNNIKHFTESEQNRKRFSGSSTRRSQPQK